MRENPFREEQNREKKYPLSGKKTVFIGAASKETLVRKKETYIYCQIGTKLLTSRSGGPLNTWQGKNRIRRGEC